LNIFIFSLNLFTGKSLTW